MINTESGAVGSSYPPEKGPALMSTQTATSSQTETNTQTETHSPKTNTKTETNGPTDTDAVRDVLNQLYDAWTNGDADAFAANYRDDATVVMPGVLRQGRNSVRDHMAAGFAGPLRGSRGLDQPEDIRVIDGHTAIVISRAGILFPGEDEVPAGRQVTATTVLSKQDGRWLIAAYANAPAH